MRIDPGLLLVILAIAVPFIVELRTVAAWIGIGLSIVQTVVIGVVVLGAIVVWAVAPRSGGSESGMAG